MCLRVSRSSLSHLSIYHQHLGVKKNDLSRFNIFNDNEGMLFPQIPLPRSHLPVELNVIYPPNLLIDTLSAFNSICERAAASPSSAETHLQQTSDRPAAERESGSSSASLGGHELQDLWLRWNQFNTASLEIQFCCFLRYNTGISTDQCPFSWTPKPLTLLKDIK